MLDKCQWFTKVRRPTSGSIKIPNTWIPLYVSFMRIDNTSFGGNRKFPCPCLSQILSITRTNHHNIAGTTQHSDRIHWPLVSVYHRVRKINKLKVDIGAHPCSNCEIVHQGYYSQDCYDLVWRGVEPRLKLIIMLIHWPCCIIQGSILRLDKRN